MQGKQEPALELINSYFTQVISSLKVMPVAPLLQVVRLLEEVRERKGHVLLVGNGGSAATASHFCGDLSKGAMAPGKPAIRAQALIDNVPLLTAWSNDTSYEEALAQRVAPWVEPGDVVIAISGSGNSPNILKAVSVAKTEGAITVGLTGFDGGKLKRVVDICVIVPSQSMEQIEDIHLILAHAITCCLRNLGFKPKSPNKVALPVASAIGRLRE